MRVRLIGWLAMLPVLALALAVGLSSDGGPRTQEERAQSIAETISCPVCAGQAVADSDAAPAEAIRDRIEERVAEGAGDDEIREEIDGRYSEDLLLTPSGGGVVGLVWVLPVVALVLAVVGIGWAFHRWRRAGGTGRASGADRDLVDRALQERDR